MSNDPFPLQMAAGLAVVFVLAMFTPAGRRGARGLFDLIAGLLGFRRR